MRVIIAGSRELRFRHFEQLSEAVASSGFDITEVYSGAARGADALGEYWAELRGIPVVRFRALWEAQGKGAGHIRNGLMAERAEALVAIRLSSEQNRGTDDMISRARERGLPVFVRTLD